MSKTRTVKRELEWIQHGNLIHSFHIILWTSDTIINSSLSSALRNFGNLWQNQIHHPLPASLTFSLHRSCFENDPRLKNRKRPPQNIRIPKVHTIVLITDIPCSTMLRATMFFFKSWYNEATTLLILSCCKATGANVSDLSEFKL